MIRGFADEVHIISGQNIIKNDIKQTTRKDNSYSDEADKTYFKAIWAISKSESIITNALKAIFKNYNVKKQLQESGIQIGIIENALKKNNDINHINHIRNAIFSRVIKENDYKIIQTTSDNIIIIHESLMDADCFADAQEIIEVDSSGKYSKESAVNIKMDEITASNIKSYLLKRGVSISKGNVSKEIVEYIVEHYSIIKETNKEIIIKEIAKALKKKIVYVESIVNMIIYYRLNLNISDTLCFNLCKRIKNNIKAKDELYLLRTIVEDLFHWNMETIAMKKDDEKKYRKELISQ